MSFEVAYFTYVENKKHRGLCCTSVQATNQLLRELHFERLGRLSIRDDDEGSLAPGAEQPQNQQPHRRRR